MVDSVEVFGACPTCHVMSGGLHVFFYASMHLSIRGDFQTNAR